MKYTVATINDMSGYWVKLHECDELGEIQRLALGDLVFYTDSGNLVLNESWLFDWEKGNKDSYAYRAIQANRLRLKPDHEMRRFGRDLKRVNP